MLILKIFEDVDITVDDVRLLMQLGSYDMQKHFTRTPFVAIDPNGRVYLYDGMPWPNPRLEGYVIHDGEKEGPADTGCMLAFLGNAHRYKYRDDHAWMRHVREFSREELAHLIETLQQGSP